MDKKLEECLSKWNLFIEQLKDMEAELFWLEANEDSLYAKLFLQTDGKGVEERKCKVHASDEWQAFQKGLTRSKSDVLHKRRQVEISSKTLDCEYLSFKYDAESLKKYR